MADIVFTSITKPLGIDCEDLTKGSSSEQIYTHLESEQDPFGARAELDHYPLYLIASNIKAKSVVLHWPTMGQLLDEIEKSKPKYVAMQVTTPTFERAENMTKRIKAKFPDVQVIYGGYAPEQGSADFLILGEGVSKFQKFLGEEQTGRINHPLMYLKYAVLNIPIGGSGVILEKVGCHNNCDFCSTSHYHESTYRYLLDKAQLNTLVSRYLAKGINEFTIFNEDHLKDKEKNAVFHKHLRSLDQLVYMTCFGCMASVNQYKVEDLFDLGYIHLWTGFEDFSKQYGSKNNYDNIKEYISNLHAHGILVIGSSFIGDPGQSLEDCQNTIDKMIELAPYTIQMNIKTPFRGTRFYSNVKMNDGFRYKDCDGHHLVHEHPTISKEKMEAMQQDTQKRDYFELGPSIVRALDIKFQGYNTFKSSQVPRIKKRVEQTASILKQSLPLIDYAIEKHPNPEVQERIKEFRGKVIAEFGTPSWYLAKRWIVKGLGFYESLRLAREKKNPSKYMRQPKFKRSVFNF